MYIFSEHQRKQLEVISKIEKEIKTSSVQFSTIAPVEDFEEDTRMCLTSVHFPHQDLLNQIQETVIRPLAIVSPEHYYYSPSSLHITIKNIRVINDPPRFNEKDIKKAKKILSEVVPSCHSFQVYFYRLLLFPYNLALVGTTDSELDTIINRLDNKLDVAGLSDDKQYSNDAYFFTNMTLVRFTKPISQAFREKIKELGEQISFQPYKVNSVSLVTCNAVFKKRKIHGSWNLKNI